MSDLLRDHRIRMALIEMFSAGVKSGLDQLMRRKSEDCETALRRVFATIDEKAVPGDTVRQSVSTEQESKGNGV